MLDVRSDGIVVAGDIEASGHLKLSNISPGAGNNLAITTTQGSGGGGDLTIGCGGNFSLSSSTLTLDDQKLVIGSGSSEAIRIDSTYNGTNNIFLVNTRTDRVGINQAIPAEALDVLGNIEASGSITGATLAGPLSTGAQPNITSVGTLTGLSVSGGVVSNALFKLDVPDNGGAPATTAIIDINGYEGRGAGITIQDNKNSAAGASNREWFIGSGYFQTGFNIGYASDGNQSSYAAQNKLTIDTSGNVGIGTATPSEALDLSLIHI